MIKTKNLTHYYKQDLALSNINLEIKDSEFVAIKGESGSGKSTLLSILSTLLKPSRGEISFDMKIDNIDKFRRENIGFIFQFHYLINYLSIYENVELASLNKSKDEINSILDFLGIKEIKDKYPDEISGGQRQRGAIARAIINKPKYIFADEPTGNLDSKNSKIVYDILRELNSTIVVASHEDELISKADRVIKLKDGKINV